jgi:hypothetical protein
VGRAKKGLGEDGFPCIRKAVMILPMKNILSAVSLLVLSASVSVFAEEKSLFNGKDLAGWEGNAELWSVKDGVIRGETKASLENPAKSALKHNTFLVWKGTVGDFELRAKVRITSAAGNSGIQYRSKRLPDGENGPIVSGYQADFEAGPKYSGITYEERGRGILAQRGEKVVVRASAENAEKPKIEVTGSVGSSAEIQASIHVGDWNEYRIVAKGNHLEQYINGKQTVDVTDEHEQKRAAEGILALQIHAGPPMVVEFKEIVLKELK